MIFTKSENCVLIKNAPMKQEQEINQVTETEATQSTSHEEQLLFDF